MALILVLGLMSVVFVVAATSIRLTMLAERSSRNDRDRQIAFQGAEAALRDAELDIMGPNTATNSRCSIRSKQTEGLFVSGCGNNTANKTRGLCEMNPGTALPLYTSINFEESNDNNRRYTLFGEFTGRTTSLTAQSDGGISAQPPRYIIELVNYDTAPVTYSGTGVTAGTINASQGETAFLVTAVGYGASVETKVMLQAVIFKPLATPGC
ncbi:pilus assembly PilX family protein [Variovorax terrae]|uniref:PilX N-terminal domain-containing pilus assembly protein n=1 Tax=Variovorax terrae TaxID=2923278 RepID=A0A9X1VT19_9BURK|nr:PilX N-terminal domain-containing pilus assembly protein [Variovorax terrae]MCJ0762807.1 PilX N-terminal domain-containing pilus assembly protein [Variovorax terrae]